MLELISRRLREVTVRPAVGADERCRWDALMGAHHYLPFRGLVGRSVRHVAVLGEHWLALVGWHAGAFKLRARDRWIGWLPEQQFRRLHLIANNARFLILPECAAANLASRVLGLSLRRLSGDFRAMHGHPILIAETFVDPARFTGACYRAANWQALGHTRGFARKPGTPATWVPHGRPKEVLVYPLARDAREQLCRLDDAPKWRSEGDPRPWTAHRLRSLWECLHGVPDFRSTRGRRYPLATILAIAVAAKLAGYHGATAIGEFSQALTQHQLRALRAFYSPRLGRFTAPSTTAFVKVLTNLDPDALDRAARTWAAQQASRTDPVAIDGKYIRGAARHNPGAKHLLVAAAEHRSGIVLGQEAVEDKSNEIPAVRTLVTERSRATAYRAIRAEITRLVCEAKQLPVLVIDEAQHLRNDVLEDLRLLTNFAMDSENRLCLLLVGLTELRRRLAMAVHESLSQRLVVRHHLAGIERSELDAYLTHRLHLAGCELPLFEPPAVEALFQSARGLPRLINRIAHYALTAAAVKGAHTVTAEHLEHAVAELRL